MLYVEIIVEYVLRFYRTSRDVEYIRNIPTPDNPYIYVHTNKEIGRCIVPTPVT